MTAGEEALVIAILTVGLGSRINAFTVWSIWTPQQREEAARVVAPILGVIERHIETWATA